MGNKYRVAMQDSVNGETFTFAVHYHAANANSAGQLAINEWSGLKITEIRCVTGNQVGFYGGQ